MYFGISYIVIDENCISDMNKSLCDPMFVECRLTIDRCNSLGLLICDSHIEEYACFLSEMKVLV